MQSLLAVRLAAAAHSAQAASLIPSSAGSLARQEVELFLERQSWARLFSLTAAMPWGMGLWVDSMGRWWPASVSGMEFWGPEVRIWEGRGEQSQGGKR
jgi:hypothetical protein